MKQPRFQVYPARDGWRWRLLAANGRTIADSGEAYTRKQDADRAVRVVTETVEHIGHKAMISRIKGGNGLRMSTRDTKALDRGSATWD